MNGTGPQTYSDERIDIRARAVWWKCMDRIEQVLDKTPDANTSALLAGLGACAHGAGVVIQDEQSDGEEYGNLE